MSWAYAAALVVSLAGIVTVDRRLRLFLFADARRAVPVLVAGVLFFIAWDLVGIGFGVFFEGATAYMTGLRLAPELPVEEVGFLTLLCYLTMTLYLAAGRYLLPRRPVAAGAAAPAPEGGR